MEKVGKIVTIVLWVLLIVSAVLVISLMMNISDNNADPSMGGWINTSLIWAYVLFAVGVGLIVLFSLIQMITDVKAARKGLISIAFLAVVALISYLLASDVLPQFPGVQKYINDGTLTPQVAKLVDAGLYATYILLGISFLSIIFSTFTRLFR